jgi:hypothetical protein
VRTPAFHGPAGLLAVLAIVAACSGRGDGGGAAPVAPADAAPVATEHVVTLREPRGAIVAELRWMATPGQAPDRCLLAAEVPLEIRRTAPDRLEAVHGDDGAPVLALAPGAAGPQLLSALGEPVGRLARSSDHPDRVGFIDPIGVPVFRVAAANGGATISDRAGAPVVTVTREGNRFAAALTDGALTGHVAGTTDPVLASLLVAPDTDLSARALLACERALATP